MGKPGEKQKRRPKFSDKKQSERFKETAREAGAKKPSDAFDSIISQMGRHHTVQYVLRGSRGGEVRPGTIGPEKFPTLKAALERAAILYDQPAQRCMLEILLGENGPSVRDMAQMEEWNNNGRPPPPD